MKTLQGPVICHPAARAKHAPVSILPVNTFLRKHGLPRSGFWGSKGKCRVQVSARCLQPCGRTGGFVHCSFSSSSDGNGSVAGNFSENDGEYVNSSVIEAGFEAILGCYFVCIDHKHRLRHEPKKSRVKQLHDWLGHWNEHFLHTGQKVKGKKPIDSGAKKAALLSGSLGIGNTTSAKLVSQMLRFQIIEVNASDNRGKADTKIAKGVGETSQMLLKYLLTMNA